MEAMAAVERLIKKRIERVLVPGFQPSGATVAALMGDEPSAKGRATPRGRASNRPRKDRRPGAGHSPKRAADPIFSAPYEPAASARGAESG
jgi:hypothetical protein